MSIADIILIALIAAAVIFAIIRIKRKGGSCGGDCSVCGSKGCPGRKCDKNNDDMV